MSVRADILAAVARNGVIGADGDMPWHLPSDLKSFRSLTIGKPIIMGRKTFEAIGKALPGRTNIVVTRTSGWQSEGAMPAGSLEIALELAKAISLADGRDALSIIGGGEIYRQAMPFADRLVLTEVDAEPKGDTFFPAINAGEWQLMEQSDWVKGENDSAATRLIVHQRRDEMA